MARPTKKGLDYFPLDVDIFQDEKVVPITVEFGLKGEIIVIRLLCAIYRNGYYIEWNDAVKYKLVREMPSVSNDLLEAVVNRMVKWRMFDRDAFSAGHVLTSAAIQRRYFSAVRRRGRRPCERYPHLLIDIPDSSLPPPKHSRMKPAPKKRVPTQRLTMSNAECLAEFFAPTNQGLLEQLCKNLSIPPDQIATLHTLADAVIAEWELSHTTHTDYSDWSRHLMSSIRIKHRDTRPTGKTNKKSTPPPPPPSANEYSFGGGFGGQDT